MYVGRLVYRKGLDLLIDIIPQVCSKIEKCRWIIAGDGPKRVELEEMVEKNQLFERVEIIGSIHHANVRDVLVRGDVFVNCSLTEAFCMAMVEAASCGLYVVSTNVGGVPEVLPEDLVTLAKPNSEDMFQAVLDSASKIHFGNRHKIHERVKQMYNWNNIAQKTEKVYDSVSKKRKARSAYYLGDKLKKYYRCGRVAGKIICVMIVVLFLLWCFLEWLVPESSIDVAVDMPFSFVTKGASPSLKKRLSTQQREKKDNENELK